jgi:hypothetical protein
MWSLLAWYYLREPVKPNRERRDLMARISIICKVYEHDENTIKYRHTSDDISIEGEAQMGEELYDYAEDGTQLDPTKVRVSFDLVPHEIEAVGWAGPLKAEGT